MKWYTHTASLTIYALLVQDHGLLTRLRFLRRKYRLLIVDYLDLRGICNRLVIPDAPLLLMLSLLYNWVERLLLCLLAG